MLVLSRQRDETIMIGDDIEITVVDIRGDKVRLGITAPTRISVHRKEVYEAIKAENQKAAQINGHELPSLRENPAAKLRPRPSNLASSARLRPSTGPTFPNAQQGGAQSA
jgi:carbon storage regulator